MAECLQSALEKIFGPDSANKIKDVLLIPSFVSLSISILRSVGYTVGGKLFVTGWKKQAHLTVWLCTCTL